MNLKTTLLLSILILVLSVSAMAQGQSAPNTTEAVATTAAPVYPEKAPSDPRKAQIIPENSKVYIVPAVAEDQSKRQAEGFENYLAAAFRKKNVRLLIVADRSQADFEIRDSASSHGAGFAKKLLLGDFRKSTTASIELVNLRTGVVAFADSSDRSSANRGLRSSAEKLAKYLKKRMDEDARLN